MKTRHFLGIVAVLAVAISSPSPLRAQADARGKLAARLDSGAVAAIMPIIDAAQGQGLPVDPLVQKALEGASKHAPADRIVLAVRRLSTQLGTARTALGDGASAPELVAGASALQAGVRADVLASLRAHADERTQSSLAVPLGVLAELIARGVPADTGAMAVTALLDAQVTDAQLVALRHDVERDIGVGAPPTTALIARTTGLTGDSFSIAASGTRKGSSLPQAGTAPRRRP